MAPTSNQGSYGKIVSTVLHVIEHEDTKAAILEDLRNDDDTELAELLEDDDKNS